MSEGDIIARGMPGIGQHATKPPVGKRDDGELPFLPMQRTRRGRAGYKGRVKVYDPQHPNIKFVADDNEPETPPEEPATKRRKRQTEDK